MGHPGYGKCDAHSRATFCWDTEWLTFWARKKSCGIDSSTPDCQAIYAEMEAVVDDSVTEMDLPPARHATDEEWLHAGAAWILALSEALDALSEWLQDPQNILMANAGDVNAQIDLSVILSEFVISCDTLETRVGPPPTVQLEKLGNLFSEVCGRYRQAALKISRGVESLDVDLILEGGTDIVETGVLLEGAKQEIRQLGDVGDAADQWELGPS